MPHHDSQQDAEFRRRDSIEPDKLWDDVQLANSLVKGELFISKYNYNNCIKLSASMHRD